MSGLNRWLVEHGGTVRPSPPSASLYARLKLVAALCRDAPEAGAAEARLLWRSESGAVCARVLGTGVVVVGRQPDCDLCFDLPRVSRRHCEIRSDGTHFLLRDLGSTNLTWVNGRPLSVARELCDGDLVQAGEVVLVFRRPG